MKGVDMIKEKLLALQVAALMWFEKPRKFERGQTAVEWAGIAFVVVALVIAFRGQISGVVTALVNAVKTAIGKLN